MNHELIQKIRAMPNLPSLPAIAMQVLDLAQQADVDIAEIARIISKDPAMSSKILRTVNSSFYGRSQNVSTISHALVILGLQSVKTLVLGFSLVTNLTKNKARASSTSPTGSAASSPPPRRERSPPRCTWCRPKKHSSGRLLVDIGMLVLDQVLGEQYGELARQSEIAQRSGRASSRRRLE